MSWRNIKRRCERNDEDGTIVCKVKAEKDGRVHNFDDSPLVLKPTETGRAEIVKDGDLPEDLRLKVKKSVERDLV